MNFILLQMMRMQSQLNDMPDNSQMHCITRNARTEAEWKWISRRQAQQLECKQSPPSPIAPFKITIFYCEIQREREKNIYIMVVKLTKLKER